MSAVGSEGTVVIVSGAVVDVGVAEAVDESVAVTIDDDETVTMADHADDAARRQGEVEPVVRLNITLPAGMRNGVELPREEMLHSLDDGSKSAQQKCKPS